MNQWNFLLLNIMSDVTATSHISFIKMYAPEIERNDTKNYVPWKTYLRFERWGAMSHLAWYMDWSTMIAI